MLGLAEAGQVRVDGGGGRTLVAEVDLDLAEIFALFEQVGGVGMTQGVDMGLLGEGGCLQRETEGALQGAAAHGLGGGGGFLVAVTFAGEEQRGMAMGFPLLAQEVEGALGQWDIPVPVALAGADVEEQAFGVDVADLEAQGFAQAQAAGVDGGQADPVVQFGHGGEEAADLAGGEDDRELELGIGAGQIHLGGPGAAEGFLPEDFEGADGLGAGLAGDFLVLFEVDAVLAKVFRRDQVGGLVVELAELADAGVVGLFGARADGQQFQVIGEGV